MPRFSSKRLPTLIAHQDEMPQERRIQQIPTGWHRCRFSVGAAIALLAVALPCSGQNPAPVTAQPVPAASLSAKEARDAKIVADAEKLYQLALDLKVEVDKSNKDTVSLTVAKRAAELEKLAKTLKQEMRAN